MAKDKKVLFKIPTDSTEVTSKDETTVEKAVVQATTKKPPKLEEKKLFDVPSEVKTVSEKKSKAKKSTLTEPKITTKKSKPEKKVVKKLTPDEIFSFDGMSVGSRITAMPKNDKRITRDRRREEIEKRKQMKLTVAGEEKELSEASKYMLDMLTKDKNEE